MKSKNQRPKRKAYRPPRLVVYGNFRSLTRAKGGTKQDGGGKANTRTGGMPT
ncbi:MAG: lasso RiPP family leader peptide-containing protein [Candidatus Methylomirabilales bacterium]